MIHKVAVADVALAFYRKVYTTSGSVIEFSAEAA